MESIVVGFCHWALLPGYAFRMNRLTDSRVVFERGGRQQKTKLGLLIAREVGSAMASAIKSGALVFLEELHPPSPFFADGSSLRVIGKLQEYSVETALAIIVDGGAKLKVNTDHLRDLSFRIGSIYQFIGELSFDQPENEAILQARVGRNVDGIDLNLYRQSVQLVRQFQAEHTGSQMAQ